MPVEIQKTFEAKLLIMQQNMKHPSLRIKKMKGTGNIYEGSITMKYRFTFEHIEGGVLLRNIGMHDDALDNP
jgi:hypothetical protein